MVSTGIALITAAISTRPEWSYSQDSMIGASVILHQVTLDATYPDGHGRRLVQHYMRNSFWKRNLLKPARAADYDAQGMTPPEWERRSGRPRFSRIRQTLDTGLSSESLSSIW